MKAAGEGREVGESFGEGELEQREKRGGVKGRLG